MGWIIVGSDEERAIFSVDSVGNVSFTFTTNNIVGNNDQDGKVCVGTDSAQEPLVIKNRLGSAKNIMLQLWYD